MQRSRPYADVHPHHCDCAACTPYVPSHTDLRTETQDMALIVVFGLLLGLVLTAVIDAITGTHAIADMIGSL